MCIRDRDMFEQSREDICEWRKVLNEMREESLQEGLNKNTHEQIINDNNKKEEEIINTKPVIEPIKKNDNNISCELLNEHSETCLLYTSRCV